MFNISRICCNIFHQSRVQTTLYKNQFLVEKLAIFLSPVSTQCIYAPYICLCAPAIFPCLSSIRAYDKQRAVGDIVFQEAVNLYDLWPSVCQGMKHQKKKTSKTKKSHDHLDHRLSKKSKKEKRRKRKRNSLLRTMAAATGTESHAEEGQPQFSQHSDDEIIILYETKPQTTHTKNENLFLSEPKNVKHGKMVTVCVPHSPKHTLLNVEDIPLPPSNPFSPPTPQLNSIIDVETIPLPPTSHDSGTHSCMGIPGATFMMESVWQTLPQRTDKESCDKVRRSDNAEEGHLFRYQRKVQEAVADFKKLRFWVNTELGSSGHYFNESHQSTTFSVMSYNVLAQELLKDHPYLYQKHNPEALTWKHRSKTLLREIQEAGADILCLQEVQKSHLNSFYTQVENLGYSSLFKQRTNGKVDGCSLFFKNNMFELVESTSVEYFQRGVSILDRDNVGIIARLQVKGKTQQIVVATTHLLYNPRRHDIKLAQTQLLLTELERISYIGFDEKVGKPKYWPVIITGDFNMEPGTAVYHFLMNGYLQYNRLAARSLMPLSIGQMRQETLLPPHLQVSNTCQHVGVLKHRTLLREQSPEARHAELLHLKTYNSDHQSLLRRNRKENSAWSVENVTETAHGENFKQFIQNSSMEPGRVSHNFILNSVYEHERLSRSGQYKVLEASTHQNDWVTVDYIFYSGCYNDELKKKVEGPLKLLSRFTLPTRNQCNAHIKHLPNLACGSDHLPLMAHFLLAEDILCEKH